FIRATRYLANPRGDFLADEAERAHHFLVGQHAAAVEFGEHAVEADDLDQLLEPRGDAVGRADDHLLTQRFLVTDGAERRAALGAAFARSRAGTRRRILNLHRERAIELHDRLLGFGARRRLVLAHVDRHAQIDLPLAGMSRRAIGFAISLDVGAELFERAEAHGDENR